MGEWGEEGEGGEGGGGLKANGLLKRNKICNVKIINISF